MTAGTPSGSRPRRGLRRAVAAAGAGVAVSAAAVAAERYLARRARRVPDPEWGEPLGDRPGPERRVRSFDGTELAVHAVGPEDGPALVFVHGFSMDLTTWHYQWKAFSRSHRCVLYDQRGHGRSGRAAEDGYSLEALGRDLLAVLDAEVPRGPAVLVGHSMGGMAIMSLAARHPEEFGSRVRAVVLTDTAAADLVRQMAAGLGTRAAAWLLTSPLRAVLDPRRLYRWRSRALSRRAGAAFLLARATNFGPDPPPSLVEHVVGLAAQTPAEVWTDLARSLMDMDLSEALHRIAVPALVVVGRLDRITPPSSAEAIRSRLPEGRVAVVDGAGHCPMLERHEEWNRVVGRFLAEVLGGPSPGGRPHRARRAKA